MSIPCNQTPETIHGIWRSGKTIHQSETARLSLAQPADATGSPRWDYVLRSALGENEPEALRQIQQFTHCGSTVFHPNLIPVLDASDTGVAPFLVMPRLEGRTMEAHLRTIPRKPLPVALWFVRQVAQALEALHAAGWVHGDIKPENAMIGTTGHVTLIDLGFAEKIHTSTNRLFRGTPDYAAPETLTGKSVALAASDVFSLGRMLWQWMTRVETANDLQLSPVAELVEQMIASNAGTRPTASYVAKQLLKLEIESLGSHIEPEKRRRRAA